MLAMKQAFPRLGQLVGSSLYKQACASANKEALLRRLQSTTVLGAPNSNVLIRQLFDRDTSTYTYLIADRRSGDALLLDPVIDQADRDLSLVRDLNLNLKYAVNTHMHADHVTGTGLLKTRLPGVRSVISAASGAQADLHLRHGDVIAVGDVQLETRSTPGHTNGCVSYVLHEAGLVFTGDAVLIRGCGRTDFQEGNSSTLYQSVHSQIFSLPDHFVVLPAHDYKGVSSSTVGEEKRLNPRLSRSQEEFVQIMEDLKLDYPRYIDEALPANRACGLQNLSSAHSALF